MDNNMKQIIKAKAEKTIKALESNNMNGFFADTKEKAFELVKSMLESGCTVTHGGSVTLSECGICDILNSGDYNYLDRSKCTTKEETDNLYRATFSADVYLTSTNALTVNGELYNVDGNSNRVSAMLYGPKKVIVVAGYNKIVNNINEASKRVKTLTAPANCVRLGKKTYCSINGECVAANSAYPSEGCNGSDRICRNYVVMGPQNPVEKGRINVIIVGEELGY